jgi:hypothetical protein
VQNVFARQKEEYLVEFVSAAGWNLGILLDLSNPYYSTHH